MGKHSKYKGVSFRAKAGGRTAKKPWVAKCTLKDGSRWVSPYRETEREAAIDYDKKLIEQGKPPVNILKPKEK